MRRRESRKRYLMVFILIFSLMVSSGSICHAAPEENNETASENMEEIVVIEIRNVEDLVAFAENCKYDIWSVDKNVRLEEDIDLSGFSFDGVPYFNGTFDGNGHTISHVRLGIKGSDFGFFRYIGESGMVMDLKVSGTVNPSGSQKNIGGLAGVNYGIIMNSSFEGRIRGESAVGGIAGINKASGKIVSCESDAVVLATNFTGGIAGKNEGVITDCSSKSSINIEELETTLDVGGVDLGTLNLTQRVVNRNDMGGIAGNSTGIIQSCKNYGTVGFHHTGYNVGGIAGNQKGIILECINEGEIFGRKDVGGIVGQAEPYIESEYLEDKVEETRDDIKRLNNTLSGISSSMSSTSAESRRYMESLTGQYSDSFNRISENLDDLSSSLSAENPEAQGYANNINEALGNINSVGSSGEDLTEEQIRYIQDNLGVINDNLGNLQSAYGEAGDSAEALLNSVSDELKTNSRQQEIDNLANTIDRGIQSVSNGIKSAVNQMNQIVDSISNDLSVITGDEEYIEDISSIETAENTDGVISGCINRGKVNGDLNVGGIAGTMNIEYGGDPEFDLDLTRTINITLRSTVNNVVIHSMNYGSVNAKRNCAGGIVGLQELGFLYDCEGYGHVKSNDGSYLGGIAGKSAAAIRSCYSLCNISGVDYAGGICGSGYTVTDSISICAIESKGERLGSIAGMLEEEGTVKGNYFVKSVYDGVDNVSYAGVAEPMDYEEVMQLETVPEGFGRVAIAFETEDGVIEEKMIAFGGSISKEEFPEVPEKEGCYIVWPEEEALKDIRKNLSVTAEYVPWTESLAGKELSEDGKALFLTVGEFYGDSELLMEASSGPSGLSADMVLEYAYTWEISSAKEKEFATVDGHFYAPGGEGLTQLWIEKDGTWTKVEGTEDGSYLTAEIPYGSAFAVVTMPDDNTVYYFAAGAAVILLIAVFSFRIHKKRKKAAKEKKEAAEKEES